MILRHVERLLRDRFLLGMISAVALATLTPELGRSGGPLHADVAADVGIFVVFLLHGIAHPGIGVIVLPIMLYHQLQLMVCSAMAERYARRLPPDPGRTGARAPRAR